MLSSECKLHCKETCLQGSKATQMQQERHSPLCQPHPGSAPGWWSRGSQTPHLRSLDPAFWRAAGIEEHCSAACWKTEKCRTTLQDSNMERVKINMKSLLPAAEALLHRSADCDTMNCCWHLVAQSIKFLNPVYLQPIDEYWWYAKIHQFHNALDMQGDKQDLNAFARLIPPDHERRIRIWQEQHIPGFGGADKQQLNRLVAHKYTCSQCVSSQPAPRIVVFRCGKQSSYDLISYTRRKGM